MMCSDAAELAPEGLDLGCPVQPQQSTQGRWVTLFELLGTLDTQQRHQEQCQQRRAQAVEGRTDFTVELASDLHQSAVHQIRQGAYNNQHRNLLAMCENPTG